MLERIYKRFKLGCDLIKSPFSVLPQRDTVSMPKIYSLSLIFFFKPHLLVLLTPPEILSQILKVLY